MGAHWIEITALKIISTIRRLRVELLVGAFLLYNIEVFRCLC